MKKAIIEFGKPTVYVDLTAEELAQRDLDIAAAAEEAKKQRARLSAEAFRERFTPLERADIRKSQDDDVQEGREIVLTLSTVDLLSDRAQHYVRNVLGVKGKADGTPILSATRVEEVLAVPTA